MASRCIPRRRFIPHALTPKSPLRSPRLFHSPNDVPVSTLIRRRSDSRAFLRHQLMALLDNSCLLSPVQSCFTRALCTATASTLATATKEYQTDDNEDCEYDAGDSPALDSTDYLVIVIAILAVITRSRGPTARASCTRPLSSLYESPSVHHGLQG
jgi:hypothetical protein